MNSARYWCGFLAFAILGFALPWVGRHLTTPPPPDPRERYLVARMEMNPGDNITNIELQFKEQEFLPGSAPVKAFSIEDIKARPDKMLGKVLIRPIGKGEAITGRHLRDDHLTDKIEAGARAMTIPVDFDPAITAEQLSGGHVNVIAEIAEDGMPVVKMILRDVPVLAT